MRLFCGLALAYETRRNLELMLQHLRPSASINWSPPENWHITTKFIGEQPEDQLPEIVRALGTVPPTGPLEISIAGLGWFPNPHQPRFLFAGVQGPAALADLARETDDRLAPVGVPRETKPYTPHLTLARMKPPSEIADLRRAIAALPLADFGRFVAAKHLLYQSKLGPTGSQYTVLAEFPL